MSWFSARIVVSRDLAGCADRLWEEKVFLLQGDTEEVVRRELDEIIKAEEMSYVNIDAGTVHWSLRCIPVIEALLVDMITSGTEVYSRFLMEDEIRCLDP